MQLWPVEHFFSHFFSRSVLIWKKSEENRIQLVRGSLQNPYFRSRDKYLCSWCWLDLGNSIKPWITYFNQICSDFFSLHNENSWKLTPFQDQHSSLMNFVGTIPRPLPSINSTSYTFNHHVKFRFFKVSGLNPTTILGKSTRTRQMMKLNLTWNLKAGCSLKGFVEYF